MKRIVKELIKGIIATVVLLGIIKIGGASVEWILASGVRLGMFLGIGSIVVIKLLLKMVSE